MTQTKKNIRPRNGLVLVRIPKETEKRTAQGLYLPPKAAGQQFSVAEVVDKGWGNLITYDAERGEYLTDTDDLKIGQMVLCSVGGKGADLGSKMQYTGIPLAETEDLFLINQHDIFGIFPEDANLTLAD